jgi:hypothetical protein
VRRTSIGTHAGLTIHTYRPPAGGNITLAVLAASP